jgi:hypothetical protein
LAALSAPAAALCDTTGFRGLGVVLSLDVDEEVRSSADFADADDADDSDVDDLEVDDFEPESEVSAQATPVPAAMPTPSATTAAPIPPTRAATLIAGRSPCRQYTNQAAIGAAAPYRQRP